MGAVQWGGGKLERAARVAKQLGVLFEKTRAPALVVERTGEFVAANAAMLAKYGYSLEELLAMRIQDLQASGRDVDADLGRAHRGDPGELERRPHHTKDGRTIWVVPTAGPIEVDGSVLVVSVLQDVTPVVKAEERVEVVRREARSQLVSADRLAAIGRLAAGVAHDVNNPAGFVTLALQLVRDQLANDKARLPEVLSILDEAISAMLQINQTMRDLTGFSRDRARSPTDLAHVAASALRLSSHETQDRAVVERVFGDGVFANVRGARIAQVVLNLVVNAAQAIPAGNAAQNHIQVRVREDGDDACIDVTDTGPGVPAAIGDRIFEPFFTTRESSGGTGLGLWLSRTIIEEEGGTLTYENLAHGGARFTIRLPAYHGVRALGSVVAER
jgi:PAS domain S-box-containing protein